MEQLISLKCCQNHLYFHYPLNISNVTSEAVGNASLLHDSPIQKPVDLPVLPMERRVSNGKGKQRGAVVGAPHFLLSPALLVIR
ncbi:hypothetical protein CEXT_536091 [Caerostris extrusa]|uniref:Uncharacterized protein n=1 Tax=Caerostris extrusa TaxID=172846 RepID=A0AAV4UBY9_CAEEX|nr:hypothetical protein CEXT_536091 [Caerostris extrusa]